MTSTASANPAVQAVLELFQGPLSDVRFADVDAKGLESLAAEVERATLALREQEAQVASLRLALGERQEALLALAQRALSYARVYAESDDALMAQLNAISLPRAAKARKAERVKAQPEPEASAALSEVSAVDQGALAPDDQPAKSPQERTVESVPDEGDASVAASQPSASGRKGKRRASADSSEASA